MKCWVKVRSFDCLFQSHCAIFSVFQWSLVLIKSIKRTGLNLYSSEVSMFSRFARHWTLLSLHTSNKIFLPPFYLLCLLIFTFIVWLNYPLWCKMIFYCRQWKGILILTLTRKGNITLNHMWHPSINRGNEGSSAGVSEDNVALAEISISLRRQRDLQNRQNLVTY